MNDEQHLRYGCGPRPSTDRTWTTWPIGTASPCCRAQRLPDMGSFNFGRTDELLDSSYRQAAATFEQWAHDAVCHQEHR